ncbi:hypothetical protein EE612_003818 [Oryza sativa]|nr:hypothetical protein EE612_003818 [Oryza sativa]
MFLVTMPAARPYRVLFAFWIASSTVLCKNVQDPVVSGFQLDVHVMLVRLEMFRKRCLLEFHEGHHRPEDFLLRDRHFFLRKRGLLVFLTIWKCAFLFSLKMLLVIF